MPTLLARCALLARVCVGVVLSIAATAIAYAFVTGLYASRLITGSSLSTWVTPSGGYGQWTNFTPQTDIWTYSIAHRVRADMESLAASAETWLSDWQLAGFDALTPPRVAALWQITQVIGLVLATIVVGLAAGFTMRVLRSRLNCPTFGGRWGARLWGGTDPETRERFRGAAWSAAALAFILSPVAGLAAGFVRCFRCWGSPYEQGLWLETPELVTVLSVVGVVGFVSAWAKVAAAERRFQRTARLCRNCGYSATGFMGIETAYLSRGAGTSNNARCPECGSLAVPTTRRSPFVRAQEGVHAWLRLRRDQQAIDLLALAGLCAMLAVVPAALDFVRLRYAGPKPHFSQPNRIVMRASDALIVVREGRTASDSFAAIIVCDRRIHARCNPSPGKRTGPMVGASARGCVAVAMWTGRPDIGRWEDAAMGFAPFSHAAQAAWNGHVSWSYDVQRTSRLPEVKVSMSYYFTPLDLVYYDVHLPITRLMRLHISTEHELSSLIHDVRREGRIVRDQVHPMPVATE